MCDCLFNVFWIIIKECCSQHPPTPILPPPLLCVPPVWPRHSTSIQYSNNNNGICVILSDVPWARSNIGICVTRERLTRECLTVQDLVWCKPLHDVSVHILVNNVGDDVVVQLVTNVSQAPHQESLHKVLDGVHLLLDLVILFNVHSEMSQWILP